MSGHDSSSQLSDEQLCSLLEEYLAAVAQCYGARRTELLDQYPQLLPLLNCLDALQQVADSSIPPDLTRFPPVVDPHQQQTLLQTSPGLPDFAGHGRVRRSDDTPADQQTTIVPGQGRAVSGTPPGRQFGKYELLNELGRGGMGVVYRARQIDLNRIVALKMIRSHQLASDEEVRRFHAEARAAASLRHPHIVALYDVGEVEGQQYFTMDCITGSSLAAILADGPLEPETAAVRLAEVARAVHFLHERGILHRDLKPANILMDESGRPFVTDFGLAKFFDDDSTQTQSGAILGTPSYMSPEQAAGRLTLITSRSDIYSLGAILYEMLTGRPPFREASPLDTLVQVIESEPTQPSRLNRAIPLELEWICLKALEKDPDARYGSAAEFAEDLERFCRQEPTTARPSGWYPALRRLTRRMPNLVAHLGVLVSATVIVNLRWWLGGATDLPNLPAQMSVFAVWTILCLVWQRLLDDERWTEKARYGWVLTDVVLVTATLWLAHAPRGLLMVTYPMLIIGAGLFFRVSLVAFTTAAALIAFSLLVVLHPEEARPLHFACLYCVEVVGIGFMVGYQVQRVRALSRFYERRD